MTDTTPVTATIAAMIRNNTSGQELLAAISARFPALSSAELNEALQAGTEAGRTPDVALAHADAEAQRVQILRQEAKETRAYHQKVVSRFACPHYLQPASGTIGSRCVVAP